MNVIGLSRSGVRSHSRRRPTRCAFRTSTSAFRDAPLVVWCWLRPQALSGWESAVCARCRAVHETGPAPGARVGRRPGAAEREQSGEAWAPSRGRGRPAPPRRRTPRAFGSRPGSCDHPAYTSVACSVQVRAPAGARLWSCSVPLWIRRRPEWQPFSLIVIRAKRSAFGHCLRRSHVFSGSANLCSIPSCPLSRLTSRCAKTPQPPGLSLNLSHAIPCCTC